MAEANEIAQACFAELRRHLRVLEDRAAADGAAELGDDLDRISSNVKRLIDIANSNFDRIFRVLTDLLTEQQRTADHFAALLAGLRIKARARAAPKPKARKVARGGTPR